MGWCTLPTRPLLVLGLLVCVLYLVPGTHTATILLVPNMSLSHVRYFSQIGRPLVERGHTVHAVVNGACTKAVQELRGAGVGILPYYTPDRACFIEHDPSPEQQVRMMDMMLRPQYTVMVYAVLYMQSSVWVAEKDALFTDTQLWERLEELHIDLVVVDGMPLTLYNYIIPHRLDLPYISLTTAFHASFAGIPDLPSFSPAMLTTSSDHMGFLQRVQNTLVHVGSTWLLQLLPGSRDSLVVKHAPDKEPLSMHSLQRGSKLWLVNTDVALDYARTLLPNIVHIGGLSTAPAAPLPDHIAAIADSASNGLIVVSFGSLLKGLPDDVIQTLLTTFRKFPHLTVVWKYTGPALTDLPAHIHVLPWLPQSDLLGHANTRLFVTHCGNNGQFEALYHGVPMVGVPFFGDQPYNAKRMEVKGFGLHVPLSELTAPRLVAAMRSVLTDRAYTDRIQHASRLYRSRPQTPRDRAVYWVQHLLTYGGDHLASGGLHLPWYQFWCLDVAAFILTVCTVVITLSVCLLRYCCTVCCCRGSTKLKVN